jgi:hypothetical protein
VHHHHGAAGVDITRPRAYARSMKGAIMPMTTARPSTVPASPEVLVRQVAEVDPTLLSEITTTRRELEPLIAAILPPLARIEPLDERCIDIAETLAPTPIGADGEMVAYVQEVTGARELWQAFPRLAAAFPRGTGGLIDG